MKNLDLAVRISEYLHTLDGLQPLVWHQARGIAERIAEVVEPPEVNKDSLVHRIDKAERLLKGCLSAFRSYMYGNAATELAEEYEHTIMNFLYGSNSDYSDDVMARAIEEYGCNCNECCAALLSEGAECKHEWEASSNTQSGYRCRLCLQSRPY